MGRKKLDRSNKVIQTFESDKYLKVRLEKLAQRKNITISALIRLALEQYIEDRN